MPFPAPPGIARERGCIAWPTRPAVHPERALRAGIALLLARRGGRSVPDADLRAWAGGEGVSQDATDRALAALVDQRLAYHDLVGWRLVPQTFAPRPVAAFAAGARLNLG